MGSKTTKKQLDIDGTTHYKLNSLVFVCYQRCLLFLKIYFDICHLSVKGRKKLLNMKDTDVYLIEQCLKLVQKYNWIVDAFVIEFFSQHIWEQQVPATWRSCLESCSPSDLAHLLDYQQKSLTRVWPLEILALRAAVRHLAVPRIPISKTFLKQLVGCQKDLG